MACRRDHNEVTIMRDLRGIEVDGKFLWIRDLDQHCQEMSENKKALTYVRKQDL